MEESNTRKIRRSIWRIRSTPVIGRAVIPVAATVFRIFDLLVTRTFTRPDGKSEKLVSHKGNFVFVIIPKSASTTILSVLAEATDRAGCDLNVEEIDIHDIHHRHPNYKYVSVVRDPWSRTFSCFESKIHGGNALTRARTIANRQGITARASFKEFAKWLANHPEGSDEVANRHWMSQKQLLGISAGVQYQFIGKQANLENDLKEILQYLGLPSVSVPHLYQRSHKESYLNHLDEDVTKWIAQRYRDDIEEFNFKTPISYDGL